MWSLFSRASFVFNEKRAGAHLLEPPFQRLGGATLIWLRTQRALAVIWVFFQSIKSIIVLGFMFFYKMSSQRK